MEINEFDLLNDPVGSNNFIVDRILPHGVTLLCGNQNVGMNWLALKLCLCASRGVDLWGYKTAHCKTLYCCSDASKKYIRNRYNALTNTAYELQGTDATGLLEFKFGHFILEENLIDRLSYFVRNNPEGKLIVIESLHKSTSHINGASYSHFNDIIAELKDVVYENEIAMVIIQHAPTLKDKDSFEKILDSTVLKGAEDSIMVLTKEGYGNSRGKLKYTGRDIADGEIDLFYRNGDWELYNLHH